MKRTHGLWVAAWLTSGCTGLSLGQNKPGQDTFVDDTWFLWSSVDIDVQQGETISIFVDGYNGSGAFDLTITQN